MEEGSENHPKAAREKAAEKVDDPDSQAVEAKVQVRIMQSILTTPLWKRQKGKERWKERFQRKRCIYKQLKGRRQNQNQQSSVAIKEPSSAQQNPKAEEAWSAHEASWSWRSYGNRVDQYSYPDDIWQANEASWQQWTYYAGGQTNPSHDEHFWSKPRPDQSNQPTDFRYDGNLAVSNVFHNGIA